jgi:N-glycosylase/DNA lyase
MKTYQHTEELMEEFRKRKSAIRRRLDEFKAVPRKQYFYELLYCLMTPQSSAVNAAQAQAKFELLDFRRNDVTPARILADKQHYIRFHKTKAKWIEEMKKQYDEVEATIMSDLSAVEKRIWLVNNILGVSYKEATHFLRNIGKNEGLAILDRHIIKNLKYHGVIRSQPKTLTRKNYLRIEKAFHRFASTVKISTDELDLLFWSRETGNILK